MWQKECERCVILGTPFSHNHGSVENYPKSKETNNCRDPFSTSMGGRVYCDLDCFVSISDTSWVA